MATTKSSRTGLKLNPPKHSPFPKHSGLTLLEVLIALLVLSIGLVGIAVLHLNSIKYAHSSYYTSVATALALDFEERLWISLLENDGCIENSTVIGNGTAAEDNTVIGDLLSLWGDTNDQAGAVVLPSLRIDWTFNAPATGTNAHTDVPLTISWAEGRFDNVLEDREEFHYIARVICYRKAIVNNE